MIEKNFESPDRPQYSEDAIKRYEAIFGRGFVSPGGAQMTSVLVGMLGLKPGARVLDVGCGLGGGAFLMAGDFDLRVDGIDLSRHMIAMAQQKLAENGLEKKVRLKLGNCLELKAAGCYDGIFSRDVFLHIRDKARLFSTLHAALNKRGRILFTDYCCGKPPWSAAFTEYVEQRGYFLHTVDEYRVALKNAGFGNVDARDWTDRFIEILKRERKRIPESGFTENEEISYMQSWQSKIERARSGEQRWGLFIAEK